MYERLIRIAAFSNTIVNISQTAAVKPRMDVTVQQEELKENIFLFIATKGRNITSGIQVS